MLHLYVFSLEFVHLCIKRLLSGENLCHNCCMHMVSPQCVFASVLLEHLPWQTSVTISTFICFPPMFIHWCLTRWPFKIRNTITITTFMLSPLYEFYTCIVLFNFHCFTQDVIMISLHLKDFNLIISCLQSVVIF